MQICVKQCLLLFFFIISQSHYIFQCEKFNKNCQKPVVVDIGDDHIFILGMTEV